MDYRLVDTHLLAKYGIWRESSTQEIALVMIALYCRRHGIPFEVHEDSHLQKAFLTKLSLELPAMPRALLKQLLAADNIDAKCVRWCILGYILQDLSVEQLYDDYPRVLIALLKNFELGYLSSLVHREDISLLRLTLAVNGYVDYIYYDPLEEFSNHSDYVFDARTAKMGCDLLSNFLLSELLTYDSCSPVEDVAEDYFDDEYYMFNHAECIPYVHVDHDLISGLDRYYERDGFYATLHYDVDICNRPEKLEVIKKLIENGWLNQVITDGKSIILVLGVYGGYDSVNFKYFDGKTISDYEGISNPVPYSVITDEEHNCYLYPFLYVDNAVSEGYSMVALSELCEVDNDCVDELIGSPVTYPSLPRYYFGTDMREIINNARSPKYYDVSLLGGVYKEPHVHVNTSGGLFLNALPGFYMCPSEDNWALRIKDNLVSPEYFAYVLSHDEKLTTLLSYMTPSVDLLLRHKVAIIADRRKQDEIISEFIEKTSNVVNTNAVYKVALVDPDCECSDFLSWGLEVKAFDHVQGEGGVLDVFARESFVPDAIIIDAVVDSVRDRYKGLRELLSKVRPHDVPVYLYTDVSEELLQEDLHDEEFAYVTSGRYYRKADQLSIERLVRNLRNELDGDCNHAAMLKGQYQREFEAARWIDEKFPKLNVLSNLMSCLLQPNKSLNLTRGILNGLYKEIAKQISNGTDLERLNDGAFPSLLKDGCYHDNIKNIQYVIKGKVMPLPLACSIRYASDIVNGASHVEDVDRMDFNGYVNQIGSDNIARAVLGILMEFLLWLYEIKFEFGGFCIAEDSKAELNDLTWRGVLKQAKSKEYYCDTEEGGKIHVVFDHQRMSKKLGSEIIIKRVKKETQMRAIYEWYAARNDWE